MGEKIKEVKTVEECHFFHFWPGYNLLERTWKQCALNCIDCWRRDISPKENKNTNREFKLHENSRNFEEEKLIGVAIVYCRSNTDLPLHIFKNVKSKGLNTILITLGFLTEEDLQKILPFTDAVALHIKGASKDSYAKLTGIPTGFQQALRTTKTVIDKNIHLEIAYKVLPGINDSSSSIRKVTQCIMEFDEKLPFHLLRTPPKNIMRRKAPTRDRIMKKLWKIAKENLHFVYRDNLFQGKAKNTYSQENKLLIKRVGREIIPLGLDDRKKASIQLTGAIRERRKKEKEEKRFKITD